MHQRLNEESRNQPEEKERQTRSAGVVSSGDTFTKPKRYNPDPSGHRQSIPDDEPVNLPDPCNNRRPEHHRTLSRLLDGIAEHDRPEVYKAAHRNQERTGP